MNASLVSESFFRLANHVREGTGYMQQKQSSTCNAFQLERVSEGDSVFTFASPTARRREAARAKIEEKT